MQSSTDQFIKRATKKHNGYYSYVNTVYKLASEKVEITCPEHGSFWQRPNSHLNGSGCTKCRYKTKTTTDARDDMLFDFSVDDDIIRYIDTWEICDNPRALTAKKHTRLREILGERAGILFSVFGDISLSTQLYYFYYGHTRIPECKNVKCHNNAKIQKNKSVFTEYCSLDCARKCNEVKEKSNKTRNRPNSIISKKEKTVSYYQNLAKERGYQNPHTYTHSSHFPDVVEKRKRTMEENWDGGHPMRDAMKRTEREYLMELRHGEGIRNPMQIPGVLDKICKNENGEWKANTPEVKRKAKETNLSRWGGSPMRNPAILEKIRANNVNKYDRTSPLQTHISKESLSILASKEKLEHLVKDMFFSDVADSLGVHASSIQRACASHGIAIKRISSKAEKEISEFVESLGFTVHNNTRPISSSYEIDIYVPEKKLAIEYNGMYWHSEKFKNIRYHQEKTLTHQKEGITVMHIWEDDWCDTTKKPIILNKIKAKLGVQQEKFGARETTTFLISHSQAKEFYEKTHIQGHVNGTLYIGLKTSDEKLVCCMTMKNMGNGLWDLSRFASSCQVMGGLSKCLSFFKKNYTWNEIITFASLDYSTGDLYEKTGFANIRVTAPNMWYMKRGEWVRLGRRRFTKKKIEKFLPDFDAQLSEKENMRKHGYEIIYDAGSIKYTMTKQNPLN